MNKQELKKHAGLIEKYVLTEAQKQRAEFSSTCPKCAGGAEECSCDSKQCDQCQRKSCMCVEAAEGKPTSFLYTIKDIQEAFRAGYNEGLLAMPPFTPINNLIKQYIDSHKK